MEPPAALQKLAKARPPQWKWQGGDFIHALAWAPHGHTLAVGTLGGELAVLDGATGKPRWAKPNAHADSLLWAAWHPRDAILATGGQDGAVRLWEANQGSLLREFHPDPKKKWVEHGAWSFDGDLLAVAAGKKATFWTAQGEPKGETGEAKATVACIAWEPDLDARRLLVGGYGGVQVWEAGADPAEGPVTEAQWSTAVLAAAWDPKGEWVAAGTGDGAMQVWRVGTDHTLRMGGYPGKVREIAWHADGRHLSSGGGPNVVCWSFEGQGPEGSAPIEWVGNSENVTALAAHPVDPARVASAGKEQLLFLWKVGDDNPAGLRALPESPASHLAWKPDGTLLAVGCEDGGVVAFKI
ncbi:MAG TPA: hypothetical protein VIM58_11740 [Candidatus Methylacidiphilales bacterium]